MDYAKLERIRQMATMSQQLAKKDPQFSIYAGGSWEIASNLATIEFCLQTNFFKNERMTRILEIWRLFLLQQKKAWFASEASNEITKLGFLLGMTNENVRASK